MDYAGQNDAFRLRFPGGSRLGISYLLASRTAVALPILAIVLSTCSTSPAMDDRGPATREFSWQYDGRAYHLALDLRADTYAMFRERERGRDYDLFASDQLSKPFVKEVTGKLARYGRRSGLRNSEIPYFIVGFVQHLPYTVDDVTTVFDEYPRFGAYASGEMGFTY